MSYSMDVWYNELTNPWMIFIEQVLNINLQNMTMKPSLKNAPKIMIFSPAGAFQKGIIRRGSTFSILLRNLTQAALILS